MFSGIIEAKSQIISAQNGNFEVAHTYKPGEVQVGQSIAHDGACMTLTEVSDTSYRFFMMEESLNKTHFFTKKAGDFLNIERCLKVSDRLDGHFVSGHIDTTGKITHKEYKADTSLILGIEFDPELSKYTIDKGSIALNGVSLTIVERRSGYISVSLIPLTQEWTNLGKQEMGDLINIEFDLIGKYILNT